MLQPVPLFGLGVQGRSVNVNAQKRINLYCQLETDPEKNVVTMYPTPGLTSTVNFGSYPVRGFYTKGNYQYAVVNNTFYLIENDGSYVSKGTLNSYSGRCDISDNGSQIIIVDGTDGYIFTPATQAFAEITDADFPGANTVTFMNGYFIVQKPSSGRFYISGLYDGTTWDALDFATAESDPDNLVRVIAINGQLGLFGEKTTEFWGDSGAQDFPFARIGSSAIEWGLAARWSLCKFQGGLAFLRRDLTEQFQICLLLGSTPVQISTPELETEISTYAAVEDATGFAYTKNGHPFYQLNFPTADKTWLYDGQSKSWSQLESDGGRHRAEMAVVYLNDTYVTDYENGKIYLLDEDSYTDDGVTIVREFISRHQSTGEYSMFSQMWIEMEAGVGTESGQGENPQIMLSISRDGGHTYGAEIIREFGRLGEYSKRAVFNRLGRSRDWLYKFRVTDPVKTVFVAAWGRYGK
jgi:hypothetical protein